MDIKEFEKLIDEQPVEVAADEVTEALKQAEREEAPAATATDPDTDPNSVTVNMLQFGQLATNLYCGLSDTIYKRVKDRKTAPEWQPETKQALQQAIESVLSQYNVQMTPTTQLIAVIVAAEFTRYTIQTPKDETE